LPPTPAILLHAKRSALRMRFRILAICLIAACGFSIFVGAHSAIDSLLRTRDFEYDQGRLADWEVRFDAIPAARLPAVDDIPGIAAAESRLVAPGHLRLADGRQIATLAIVFDAGHPPRVNRLTLLAGRPLAAENPAEILIERNLALYHRCRVGDVVELSLQGRVQRLRVGGIAQSPEFLIVPLNPSLFMPAKRALGIVFLPSTLIEAALDSRPVNSLLLRFVPGADPVNLRRQVLDRLAARLEIRESISRAEQFGVQFLDLDLAVVAVFLPAVILVFVLATFPVVLFLVFQWIAGEHREIGTAMSLGYGRLRLSLAYLVPAALVVVGALAAGGGLSVLSLRAFALGYSRAIGLPEPILRLSPRYFGWGAAGLLATVALAVSWPQLLLWRLTPLEALREADQLAGFRHGSLAGISARLRGRLWVRYACRNVLRNRVVSAMTVVALGLGFGLVIAFSICLTSIGAASEQTLGHDRWNVLVEFAQPVPLGQLRHLHHSPRVRETIPYVRGLVKLSTAGGLRNVIVGGIPVRAEMKSSRMLSGRPLTSGDRRAVVLERNLAARLGVAVGQTVQLAQGRRRFTARVVGIRAAALLPGETYLPLAFGQELLGLGERVTGAFVVASGTPEAIQRDLYSVPSVGHVIVKQEVLREVLAASEHIRVLVEIAGGLSIPLAMLFIFSNFAFAVLQRRSDYVLLRVLGFADRTVAKVIVAEVFLLGLATGIVALPAGWWGARFLLWRLSQAWIAVEAKATPQDFLLVLFPALLLLPAAAWPVIGAVLREPLPRSMREGRFC
jgi:putative ABC transport system permease protein